MKTIARIVAVTLILGFAPTFAAGNPSTLQQRIDAERAKAAQIQAQLHAKRSELHSVTMRYQDLQSQLQETNDAIGAVNARIGDLSSQVSATQRKIDWNTIQLDAAKNSLKLHDDLLKKRLVDIYENGDLSYASVLLSARSFNDFVERWEDLRLLIAANERAVRVRKAAEARVAAVEADLERANMELQGEQEDQQRARSQLDGLASERQNLVAVAAQQRRHVATQVAQIEDLSAAEEAQLETLIVERQRELEAARRAHGIAGGGIAPGGPVGTFSWPVTGTITSPFGWRSNPFGGAPDFHPGSTSRPRPEPPSRRLPAEPLSWRNGTAGTATTSRSITAAATRPGTAIFLRYMSQTGRPSPAGKQSARSVRPGPRPARTCILRSESMARRLTQRPACIKT